MCVCVCVCAQGTADVQTRGWAASWRTLGERLPWTLDCREETYINNVKETYINNVKETYLNNVQLIEDTTDEQALPPLRS